MLLLAFQQIVQDYYAPNRTGVLTQFKESLTNPNFWFKVIILLFCAPIWWPIMKAVVREIDAALRSDGGILARSYTARELKSIEERQGAYDDPLKSIPRGSSEERRATRGRGTGTGKGTGARAGGQPSAPRGGSTGRSMRSTRRRGF